jgi:hypothetical protein
MNTNGMCNQCIFEKAKEVRKNTNLKNIGCENYFQNESIKDKIKQSNQNKYGVQYASQSEEYKKKSSIRMKGVYNGEQNITIVIDDVEYRSAGEASKLLNIPMVTIRWRVRSKNKKFDNYRYKD